MDAATIDRPVEPNLGQIWAAGELATAIGLLELELWYLRAKQPGWLNAMVYGVIVATIAHSQWRRDRSGVAWPKPEVGAWRGYLEAFSACFALSMILLVASYFVGDANETFEFLFLDKPPMRLANWLVGKFGAALIQQLALQFFLWPACLELTRSRTIGTILAASLFGLLHLPSPTLMAITTLAGVVWIFLYQRSARIEALVICHMILATLAHGALPERLTYDMRIGLTATADMKRFEELSDPHVRLVNRRLKVNRPSLRKYSALDYYRAQGGNDRSFIKALFRDIYGRTATETEVDFWVARKFPSIRDDLPSHFLASDEYARIRGERR